MNIPENIINKIMLYNSHPVADIMKKVYEEYCFDDDDHLYAQYWLERKKRDGNLELYDYDEFVAELSDGDDEDLYELADDD